ncbi:SLOG family protein [Paenibacillus sp. 1P03SA]|uniref:SLOG family protein n=1 Tax=Paenibacillus sp. 1P03SA TaxID=3132294 RepID=UPI00399F30C0
MDFNISETVCFTGHRPSKLGGYNENNPVMQYVKRELAAKIDAAIANGHKTFISGMALGVDTVAAEIVLARRSTGSSIRLIAAIPFSGQENRWNEESRVHWANIVQAADGVFYVNAPGYAAWKMQTRNEWMVDRSSLVIAVWDGTSGGTGNCVKYARKAIHRPTITTINPKETA